MTIHVPARLEDRRVVRRGVGHSVGRGVELRDDRVLRGLLEQAGWTVRPGSNQRVVVAERPGRALYASSVAELWEQAEAVSGG